VETPEGRRALVAVARAVRKRAVDRAGKHAHPEGTVAGRPVVKQAVPQGGLVEELDPEVRAEGTQLGERTPEERLVGRLGEAPNDEDGAMVVRAGELHRGIRAGQQGERLGRLDHPERETDRGARAGSRSQGEPAVAPFCEAVVVQDAQRSLRAGERHPEDRRDLGRAQSIRSLRQRNEGAQAMLGRDEATHERIVTLPA
jgi:hypothetical protein